MKNLEKTLLAVVIVMIGLHIWGAMAPAHLNWGVHFFAFYDHLIGLSALIIVALVLVPPAQKKIIALKEKILSFVAKIQIPFLVLAVSAAIMLLGTLFSSKLHLLGDGILLLRSLSSTLWGSNIMQSFNNQPLMYWLFRGALEARLIDSPTSTYDLYILLNRCSVFATMVLVFWWLRPLKLSILSRVLLGTLFVTGGGFQFFFGYIENYVLQYFFTGLFAVSGWMALERRAPISIPAVSVVIMCGLHLGNIIFLPGLLLLLVLYYPRRRKEVLAGASILGLVGLAAIYALGYFPALARHFAPESVDFLRPFSAPSGNFGYAMFSLNHLLDWTNLNLLVAPFGLVIPTAIFLTSRGSIDTKKPALLFLAAAALCGLIFTWVINSALGMARDWDLLAGFFVPLMVLDVYLALNSELVTSARYALVALVTVTLIHISAYVGVNADENRHLARVNLLNDARFLSPTTLLFFDEVLANYYFDNGKYADARRCYEHSVSIDPDNPRIVGNLSDTYRKLGEKDKYFETLKRAVEIKSTDPGIYSNLGVEYAGRGDTARAILYNERAVELDPRQEKAHANLGLLYVSKKNFPLAKIHFVKAVELGMNDPIVLKYAAEISFFMNEFPDAVKYYDAYLRQKPGDGGARGLRERAAGMSPRSTRTDKE